MKGLAIVLIGAVIAALIIAGLSLFGRPAPRTGAPEPAKSDKDT